MLAVQRGDDALDLLDDLLTVELLTAAAKLRGPTVEDGTVGRGVAIVLDQLDGITGTLGPVPSADILHREIKARLYDQLLPRVDAVL